MAIRSRIKTGLGAAAGMVVILVVAVLALEFLFQADYLKALLLPELERRINRQVTIDDVALSVGWGVGIRVWGITVADRPGFASSAPFIHADGLTLKLKILPLLHRELVIDRLTLVHPKVSIVVDTQGAANYAELSPPDSTAAASPSRPSGDAGSPLSVQLSGLSVEGGALTYTDGRTGSTVAVERIELASTLSIDRLTRAITSTGVSILSGIRIQGADGTIRGIEARLAHDIVVDEAHRTLTLRRLAATVQQVRLTLEGEIADYDGETPSFDLHVVSNDVTVGRLLASIPPGLVSGLRGVTGTGRITVRGAIKGVAGEDGMPEVQASLKVRDGELRTPDLPVPVEGIAADLTLQDEALVIHRLGARLGESDLTVEGRIANLYGGGKGSRPRAHLAFSSKLLDIDALSPPSSGGASSPPEPAAASADSRPFEPLPEGVVEGEGQCRRVRVRGLEFTDARLRFSLRDRTVRLTDIHAASSGGTVNGSITYSRRNPSKPDVRVEVRIDGVDVGRLLAPALPAGKILSGRLSTSLSAAGPLDAGGAPVESALSALGSLKIERGRIRNWKPLSRLSSWLKVPEMAEMDFRTLAGAFRIDHGRVFTDGLRLNGPQANGVAVGSAGLDGTLDYRVQVAFSETLSSRMIQGPAGRALALFRDKSGRITVHFTVGGTIEAPAFGLGTAGVRKQAASPLMEQGRKLLQGNKLGRKLLDLLPGSKPETDSLRGRDAGKKAAGEKTKGLLRGLFKRKP